MSAPRHIGIVGGSAEGAALCYRTICVEGEALLGKYAHPEVTLHTFSFSAYMREVDAGRWEDVGRLLLASAERVRRAGAELAICPDNTFHQGLDLVRDRSPIPWMHIAEVVAAEAARRGLRRVLLLGTRYLVEGPVYPAKLAAAGIGHALPPEEDRLRVHRIIFDDLVYGRFEEDARRYVQGLISASAARGCDGVVLGCTEIPLLIREGDSPLPALDSTRLLARAALRRAVGDVADPDGAGGRGEDAATVEPADAPADGS